ncbi:MAG: hypothetical protein P1V18_02980 [Candidatus Gracilibacteria bacterium]|nr:hypothetical protein [Candidatus Gracilibacteria bacterium]
MNQGYPSLKNFESDIRAVFARGEYSYQLVENNEMRYLRKLNRFRDRIKNTVTKSVPGEGSQVHSRLIYHFLNTVRQLKDDEIEIEQRIYKIKEMIDLLTSEKFNLHMSHIGFTAVSFGGDMTGVFSVPSVSSSRVAPVSGVMSAAEALNTTFQRVSKVNFSTSDEFNAAVCGILNHHPKCIPWKKVADFLKNFTQLVLKAKTGKNELSISPDVITMITFSWQYFNDPSKESEVDMRDVGAQFHKALRSAHDEGMLKKIESCVYIHNAS